MLRRILWHRIIGRVLDMLAGAGILASLVALMVFITDLKKGG